MLLHNFIWSLLILFFKIITRNLAYEILADEQKRRNYDAGGWSYDQQQQHAQHFDFDSFMREFQESMIICYKNLYSEFIKVFQKDSVRSVAFHVVRYSLYVQR